MELFAESRNHPHWGWLSRADDPWRILAPLAEENLANTISRLVNLETPNCVELEDLDLKSGPVFLSEDVSIGTGVRIEGPVFVESGAEIRHGAYLRPGTYVGRNCVIGHCSEIKNTLMLPNSKAPHFNYVGDSILGQGVNLGAGTKISNVRLDRKTVRIGLSNGEWKDSGLRKLGAMVGDHSELGCNVVTNPGAVIPRYSAVGPNTVVHGYWDN